MADADVRQLKAILAAAIIKTLDHGGLSVRKAQSLTGISVAIKAIPRSRGHVFGTRVYRAMLDGDMGRDFRQW
jgi:hypothetical protein